MRRGEIWWVSAGKPSGSEPGYRRPFLIVSSDAFNESRIATVIAAALTTNLDRAIAPGNVLVRRRVSGLPQDSVVNVSSLASLDRSRLLAKVGALPSRVMAGVDEGLRVALGLMHG